MPNIYWYIGLAVIGIASAAFTIHRHKHIYSLSTFISFYLLMSGAAWICEFIVLGLFNSYAYKTGVFENIWAQNLLGHLLLNTTVYPAIAIMTVTSKRWKLTGALFVVLLTCFDYLFVKLGLYEHHWWRYYQTTIAVVVFLTAAWVWFNKIKYGCKGAVRAVTFFFIALLVVHFPAPILLLLDKQYYQLKIINNFFGDLYLSSIIFIFAYHLLECIILVLITCVIKNRYLKLLPFLISIASQCLLAKLNLLVFKENWQLIYTLLLYEAFIAAFILLEKHNLKPGSLKKPL